MPISSCQESRIFSDLGPSGEGSGFFVALMLLIISVNLLIVKKFLGNIPSFLRGRFFGRKNTGTVRRTGENTISP